MNTREHETVKMRGSGDISYLGRTVDGMIWDFMEEHQIPGLTLAIVQAPYIPRVVGYGLSDDRQRRLASANTMWPAGPISQAFAAVAVMQLYEDGALRLDMSLGELIPGLPLSWQPVTVLQLLRHAAGLPDYRLHKDWSAFAKWSFQELVDMAAEQPLTFSPGTDVAQSATNFLLLSEIVERISKMSYRDFVTKRQIEFLGLRRTCFAGELERFSHEDLSEREQVHQLFKRDSTYIDPAEPAASYDSAGTAIPRTEPSALKGFSDIWASAQDISFWDIGLAGNILIHEPENRALIYAPWQLPDGRQVPAVAGWLFYKHRGLMDIKGSVPGFSSYLSRFTHSEELVCVTLLANRDGVDFTNLGRRIAGAFGDLLSTNYDDNKLYLFEGQFPVRETVQRLEQELKARNIPLFAEFDHGENAEKVGLSLRPTVVLVFGSPKVGTGLMQADQSIALELPLRIAVWEDAAGSTWLAFPRMELVATDYGLTQAPELPKLRSLLQELVRAAGNVYK
ncbi:MAG: serine hydrolase [Lachnospiraceae bacterium]|nr:serine hydrolase [Lachnospiraceae bacterium]